MKQRKFNLVLRVRKKWVDGHTHGGWFVVEVNNLIEKSGQNFGPKYQKYNTESDDVLFNLCFQFLKPLLHRVQYSICTVVFFKSLF